MPEYRLIRFTVDDGTTLELMVHAHDADAIYAAWLDGRAEVQIPHQMGGEPFPMPREELVSVETVMVGPDGYPAAASSCAASGSVPSAERASRRT